MLYLFLHDDSILYSRTVEYMCQTHLAQQEYDPTPKEHN